MRNTIISLAFILYSNITYSQIIDTVYFDINGKIIIEELSSLYRVAEYDTTTGYILGQFQDFSRKNDSLVAAGSVIYMENHDSIVNYFGDPEYYSLASTMLALKASYIRIRDYPLLRKFIIPSKSMEERTHMTSEYGDFVVVEELATFNGGFEALGWFLTQFIQYPEEAMEKNLTGTVKVEFSIDVDGSVTDAKIIEGIGYGCDKEVLRVMNLIPDWLPAIQHGRFVKTTYTLPIPFINSPSNTK